MNFQKNIKAVSYLKPDIFWVQIQLISKENLYLEKIQNEVW